jgi:hypothetical protein
VVLPEPSLDAPALPSSSAMTCDVEQPQKYTAALAATIHEIRIFPFAAKFTRARSFLRPIGPEE